MPDIVIRILDVFDFNYGVRRVSCPLCGKEFVSSCIHSETHFCRDCITDRTSLMIFNQYHNRLSRIAALNWLNKIRYIFTGRHKQIGIDSMKLEHEGLYCTECGSLRKVHSNDCSVCGSVDFLTAKEMQFNINRGTEPTVAKFLLRHKV